MQSGVSTTHEDVVQAIARQRTFESFHARRFADEQTCATVSGRADVFQHNISALTMSANAIQSEVSKRQTDDDDIVYLGQCQSDITFGKGERTL